MAVKAYVFLGIALAPPWRRNESESNPPSGNRKPAEIIRTLRVARLSSCWGRHFEVITRGCEYGIVAVSDWAAMPGRMRALSCWPVPVIVLGRYQHRMKRRVLGARRVMLLAKQPASNYMYWLLY